MQNFLFMISWLEKNSKLSSGITIFGAVAIFVISSFKFEGVSSSGLFSVIYHFSAFFCFSFFLFISSVRGKNNKKIFFLSVLISLIYSVLDELHQYFVPGRTSAVFDIGINSLGILFSSLIYTIRLNYQKL